MNTKRRDHRNRLLRPRESQNLDGRYRYTYYENEKQKTLYSWKLEPTDKMPVGKRPDKSLREKVTELQRQQMLYGNYTGGDYTVVDLVERYIAQQQGVRETTRIGYGTVLNALKKDAFGKRKIHDIRVSDAKMWMIQMQKNGRGYSSIHNIRGVLRLAFKMAVDDDIIIKNPFDFELKDVIENDSKKKEAVSENQRDAFLEFIRTDSFYGKILRSDFYLISYWASYFGVLWIDIERHRYERTSNTRGSSVTEITRWKVRDNCNKDRFWNKRFANDTRSI